VWRRVARAALGFGGGGIRAARRGQDARAGRPGSSGDGGGDGGDGGDGGGGGGGAWAEEGRVRCSGETEQWILLFLGNVRRL
jgi:hypothetical protein